MDTLGLMHYSEISAHFSLKDIILHLNGIWSLTVWTAFIAQRVKKHQLLMCLNPFIHE